MAAIAGRRHRVSAALARLHAELDAVADASVWSMGADETRASLLELGRAKSRVAELEARVAAHADDIRVGDEVAASSTGAWLAHESRTTRASAHGVVWLGHALAAHPAVRERLAAGDLHVDQARTILRHIDDLPHEVGPELISRAEAHLLACAREYDATALNRLGKRLFEVIAPEEADAREAAILAKEEAAALKAAMLTGYDDGAGKVCFHGTMPTYHWGALKKMLRATAARKHQNAVGGAGSAVPRPDPEAMGLALCELIERYPADKLPQTGAVSATVVVLIEEDSLMGRLEKAGVLDTGERISPGMARRLACEAGIIPAVMGGRSQPLDLGRKRRLFSDHQRLAMFLRDRGCQAEGCDRTTALHAHHKTRWADGGTTDLGQAVSLCHWHHMRAHDTNYQTTYLPSGKVQFHRRQ